MYSEKVMEEFYAVENFDVIKGASGVGKVTSEIGNEIIKIYIKVENETIVESKFQAFGGVVAIAATSVANRLIMGKTLSELKKFNVNLISNVLGEVPKNKQYILSLVASVVVDAVDNYYEKSTR